MAKAIKAEIEETPWEHKSADVAAFSSSTNFPLLWYNHPLFTPDFWPSIIQSSNHVQSLHGRQSATCRPGTSQAQENRMDVNGPRTPLYVLPYPWFFPLPDLGNGVQPQPYIGVKNKEDETSDSNQYDASSSSKIVSDEENPYCFFPIKVKTEASGSTEVRPPNDLSETPVGFPPDGGGQHTGAHSKEMLFTPPLNCAQPESTVKHESRPLSDDPPNIATPSTACHIVNAMPEKKQESVGTDKAKESPWPSMSDALLSCIAKSWVKKSKEPFVPSFCMGLVLSYKEIVENLPGVVQLIVTIKGL